MTNLEKIKNMSISKLAKCLDEVFICEYCSIVEFCGKTKEIKECKDIWKKWLRSKVEDND